MREKLQSRVMDLAMSGLTQAGYTPKSLAEGQRDTLWWTWARVQAGLNVRPLEAGWGIAWSASGYAELVPVEVPRPGRGRVSVVVGTSAVSPGTERAQYLRLPNAQVGVLGRPGYSASGIIRAVGPGVEELRPGDPVAVTGAAHASLVTVKRNAAHKIPPGASPEGAALVMLGTICRQGVRLAALEPGQEFCVVGAGLVGALALRLAARNAAPAAVIATSRRREKAARRGGARRFLVTGEDADEVAALSCPVVIEATGDPRAISVAIDAAAPGGRIVLLGSPRGTTPDLRAEAVRQKGLEIVGAHVDTLDLESARTGVDARRREAETFLAALTGGLDVSDLLGRAVDPREASLFYRELAGETDLVGAHFDWTRLPPAERAHRGHLLRPPNVTGRGMERRWPLHPGRRRPLALTPPDPFAGAVGDLRIGMLGCGDIAVQNAGAAAGAPNTRLTACFDPAARLAEDLASRHGARALPSAEALVGAPEVDAVLISVPHHLHAPLGVLAAQAGKHVIVEKPQANTLESAVEMARAARRAGVVLSVCFPQRYHPAALIARRLVRNGALGPFGGSSIRLYLDKSSAYWRGGFSGRSQSDWRSSREKAGGGVLIMNLSHHLDLVRHLVGVEAESVVATVAAVGAAREVEDAVTLGVTYANGAVGSLVGSSAVRGTTEEELSVWGRDGHVALEPRPRVYSLKPLDGVRTARWQSFGVLPPARMRVAFLSSLASAIHRGEEPDITAEDGLAVQALIEATYQAGASGQAVRPRELLAAAGWEPS